MRLREFGETYLQDVANMADKACVPVETVLREGLPPEVIVKEAEDRGVDLIIMGTRGLSGAKRVVLGSTAAQVVEWAPCPVLVVK
jgi:nucleotide-binding universal stress UspA family protein